MRPLNAVLFVGGWLAWVYTLAVTLAELVIGIKAAQVVASYYDFAINNVSIDAFCRDIYKNTKDVATTYIIVSGISMLWLIVAFVYWLVCSRKETLASYQPCAPVKTDDDSANSVTFGPLVVNALTSLTALAFGAFLTWKRHDLSSECRDFWNNQVSPDFLAIFGYCQELLIATAVVGGIWCIILCVVGVAQM
jgi:hypothetical protein